MTDNSKVALGLSGGVDSTAAALLLRDAGYEVYGFWLDVGVGSPERPRGVRSSWASPSPCWT